MSTNLKFKDLGKWGKSIGNITLHNGMYLELTDETWNNKSLRDATLKLIDNHIQAIKKQEKQFKELTLMESLHQGMQIFNIKTTTRQSLLIKKRPRKECTICHKFYKNNSSLTAHQYHYHKKRWQNTLSNKGGSS